LSCRGAGKKSQWRNDGGQFHTLHHEPEDHTAV
jgi:hypothetical protein